MDVTSRNMSQEWQGVDQKSNSSTVDDSTVDLIPTTCSVDEDSFTPFLDNFSFYTFYTAVVAIGVVGTGANALILYALVFSKQHKKHPLICNQNALDFFSSLFLVVTFGLHLSNIHLTGAVGYWLCMLILSENILYVGIIGSKINLTALTIERYLKIVHPVWSKKRLRSWIIYSAIAFTWASSLIYSMALTFPTTVMATGYCVAMEIWPSETIYVAYGVWAFLSVYAIPILIFTFCYGRILVAIRRQARVMAGHNTTGSNNAQPQSKKIQTNVIKTMILVTVFFAASQAPLEMYFLLTSVGALLHSTYYPIYYASLFASFFYICTNPTPSSVNPQERRLVSALNCVQSNCRIGRLRTT